MLPVEKQSANPLSRRKLFRLGAVGAASVAVGGGLLRWFRFGYASHLSGDDLPLALSLKELAIVKAVVEAMLPEADGFPSGVSLRVHQGVDEQVWAADPAVRSDFKNGLQLLEHGTLLFGYSSRLSALPPEQRCACLDRMINDHGEVVRQAAFAVKELVHLLYYADERVWKLIGYEGPLVPKAVPPQSAVAYRELLAKEPRA